MLVYRRSPEIQPWIPMGTSEFRHRSDHSHSVNRSLQFLHVNDVKPSLTGLRSIKHIAMQKFNLPSACYIVVRQTAPQNRHRPTRTDTRKHNNDCFLPRGDMVARYMLSSCVRPSVWLSVRLFVTDSFPNFVQLTSIKQSGTHTLFCSNSKQVPLYFFLILLRKLCTSFLNSCIY